MRLLNVLPANSTIIENEELLYSEYEIVLKDGAQNDSMYNNWNFINIQYSIDVTTMIYKATFSTSESMRPFKARHLVGVYYDSTEFKWKTMRTVFSETKETISIEIPLGVKVFGFALNTAWYSSFTQQLADEYPIWTKVRKDIKSIGQQFLNFFGLTFEEAIDWINWTQEQKYVETLDVYQIDWAYIYDVPLAINMEDSFKVYDASNKELIEIYTVRTFMDRFKEQGYLVDVENRKLLTRRDYGTLTIKQEATTLELPKQLHHIWNSVDEMALLFGVMRATGESNENLKQRTLDVFRYPAGAHKTGLYYGIARELLLMNRVIWKNDSNDFYIKANGHHIIKETLSLNHVHTSKYENLNVTYYNNGDIRIKAMNTGKEHTITFLKDMSLHELHNKKDEELYDMMFQENGQASPKLLKWTNEIKQISPIMWDQTRWNKSYWDTVDKKATGLGYIPNQWDSTLDAWEDD